MKCEFINIDFDNMIDIVQQVGHLHRSFGE